MKLQIIFISALLPVLAGAQVDPQIRLKNNVFKIAPQQFRVKSLKIGLEHINSHHTRSYSVYAIVRKEKNNQLEFPVGYDGLGGEFSYKIYLKPIGEYSTRKGKSFIQGIYVSGFVQGHSFSGDEHYRYVDFNTNTNQPIVTNYEIHESVANWGTGFTIGIQQVFWQILTVDAFVGGGIQWSDVIRTGNEPPQNLYVSPSYSRDDPRFNGILPKVGVQLGVML
ncbi:MAG: hypothetical protein R2820_01895 [Cyclobacteriaceae bacterium]